MYLYLLPPQRRLKQLKSQWGLSIWRYLLSMAGLVEVDVLEDGLRRKLVRVGEGYRGRLGDRGSKGRARLGLRLGLAARG